MSIEEIVDSFNRLYNYFSDKGLISEEDLVEHTKSDTHSWLQYLMVKAGEDAGFLPIPEIKIRFNEPADLINYGLNKKRKRSFSRVDIGFYDINKALRGVSEIITMDESHGALKSSELARVHNWFTPRDSFPYMMEHSRIRLAFIILVVILCKHARRVQWKTGLDHVDEKLITSKYDYYATYKPYWEELGKEIKTKTDVALLLITEDGIERIRL